jgi:hypothetical protein
MSNEVAVLEQLSDMRTTKHRSFVICHGVQLLMIAELDDA